MGMNLVVMWIQQTSSTSLHSHFTSLGITRLSIYAIEFLNPMYYVMEGFYFTINSFLLCSSITLANQVSISSHSALRLLGAAGGNHQLRLRKVQALLGHRHWSDIPLYLQFLFLHPVSSRSTLFKPQILPHLKEITSYFTETTGAVI